MMGIKRYEPGAYGAMNESEDGKFYHKRDVDELICALNILLSDELTSLGVGVGVFVDEIEIIKKWGVK